MRNRGNTKSSWRAQTTAFTQSKTLHSLKYHKQGMQLETDEAGYVCSRKLSVWRDSFRQHYDPCLITINSGRILGGLKPDDSFTDCYMSSGYHALANGRVVIKPELHMMRSSTGLPLVRVVHGERDKEIRSYVGEYQADILSRWV